MNFLKKIFNKTKNKSTSFLRPFYSVGGSLSTTEDYYDMQNLQAFRDSLYLFIGVSMIRDTGSDIPTEVYRMLNIDGEVEQVFDDKFIDLINRPNKQQTKKEFDKLSISYYLLGGETFWYLERDSEIELPKQMVNMRTDYVEILLSSQFGEVIGYNFWKPDGTVIKLMPYEVLHIKNIDPINPIRGIGVVRPARKRIATEQEASKYQEGIFKNFGRPDIAVFTDEDIDDEQAKDARERWQKTYGSNEGSKAGFFGRSVKSIELLSVNPKEMDFINSQNFLRDDILASLRIPKAMITSDDVNLANSKTARINYLKEAVIPVREAFDDVINNKLLADIPEYMDMFITYDNPVNEDRDIMLKEATELKKSGIITINEARSIMEFEEVEGGDELREQTSPFQLSVKNFRKKNELKKKAFEILSARAIGRKKIIATGNIRKLFEMTQPKRQMNSIITSDEMRERYIKTFNDKVDKRAKDFKDTVDLYNQGLRDRIIENLDKLGIAPDNILDVNQEVIEAKKIFNPLVLNMFKKEGQKVLDNVANGFSEKASEQFYTAQEVIEELAYRVEFFTLSMLDTDFNELSAIISEGMKQGEGMDKIGIRIREYFNNMTVARAKTIARTETGRLMNKATEEAYRQSEVVTGKEWLTAGDDLVRPEHQMNNGVIRANGEAFPNGEHYPAEFTINCRCALAPAI